MTRFWAAGAVALVIGCADDPTEGPGSEETGSTGTTTADTGTGTSGTSTTEATSSSATTADTGTTDPTTTASTDTGPDVELQHGYVRVLLTRAPDETEDPFAGTARIEVAMTYQQCLFDFYAANPSWQQDGDDGEAVFGSMDGGGEGWFDRLCEVDAPDLVQCQVISMLQQIEGIPQLRVMLAVSGEVEDRVVPFGPLPTAELAQCAMDLEPTVRLVNGATVRGLDEMNEELWRGSAFAPTTVATNEEEPIVVEVVRAN